VQRKNPWFMTCQTWFTDGLLTRNAYCMAYWEKDVQAQMESYQGLTDDQLALIMHDEEVQVVQHSAYATQIPVPGNMLLRGIQQDKAQGIPVPPIQQMTLHDVVLRRSKNYGCVKLAVLPPERCLVAQDCRDMSVRDCDFFEYWEYKTLSQLRAEGFQVPDDIEDSAAGASDRGIVDQYRDITNQTILSEQSQQTDPSMRKVKARMIWIRNDYDSDGIAELRYVVAVGDTILVNDEVSGIPVASIVPYPMPHRHVGLSVYDIAGDLQLIKSVMLRSGIDNQFLINNGRYGVDKNRVNLDDMATSRPGGQVRTDGPPSEAIMPFTHPDTGASTMRMMEYLDQVRQDRGGVQKPMAGADLTAINAQPGTVAQLAAAASQKIELIARIFGEGVKELMLIVHELTLTNATMQEKVKLRGKWATVDPREWKKRSDMSLAVGLGIGNRQQHAAAVTALIQMQEKVAPLGLATMSQVYAAHAEYTKALGFGSGAQFFTEPPPGQPFPQSPPYQIQVAQINAQAETMIQQMKNQGAQTIAQLQQEAAGIRAFYETSMEQQSQSQQNFLRAVSEATDRMHELRLEHVRSQAQPAAEGKQIQLVGLEGIQDSVKKATEAAQSANDNVKAVTDKVNQLHEEVKKPKKRTIKAPSGKTYTVEG